MSVAEALLEKNILNPCESHIEPTASGENTVYSTVYCVYCNTKDLFLLRQQRDR